MYDPDEQVADNKVDFLQEASSAVPLPENVTGLNEKDLSGAGKQDSGAKLSDQAGLLGRFDPIRRESLTEVSEALKTPDPNRFGEAQRILEKNNMWIDATRYLAQDINQADQELRGEKPLTFDEAINKLNEQAFLMQEDGRDEEFGGQGAALESALRGADASTITLQLESVNDLLTQTEQSLASWESTKLRLNTTDDGLEELTREDRAIRDALLRRRDELVEKEKNAGEQREIADIRTKLKEMPEPPPGTEQVGAPAQQGEVEQKPSEDPEVAKWLKILRLKDRRELVIFEKEEFTKQLTEEQLRPLLEAYYQKKIQLMIDALQENTQYIDHVASVAGIAGPARERLMQMFRASKGNREPLTPEAFQKFSQEFDHRSFKEVAQIIGLDVTKIVPDYDASFRPYVRK